MFVSKSAASRSLLAGSLFATTALAGLGGIVGSIILTPGAAFAQTCTPDTNGTSLAPAPVGPATEVCVGGNTTGIGYSEGTTGGNLTVNLNGPGGAVVNGVLLDDVVRIGHAANLTLVLGNATTIGQNIVTAGNQSLTGVTIISTGGNVAVVTGNNTPGEIITGNLVGMSVSTIGNGTVNVSTIANITGLAGNGISTTSVDGSNTVAVGGNVVGNFASSGVAFGAVDAFSTGNGTVLVTLGNITTVAGNTTTVTPFSVNAIGENGVVAINDSGVGNPPRSMSPIRATSPSRTARRPVWAWSRRPTRPEAPAAPA